MAETPEIIRARSDIRRMEGLWQGGHPALSGEHAVYYGAAVLPELLRAWDNFWVKEISVARRRSNRLEAKAR